LETLIDLVVKGTIINLAGKGWPALVYRHEGRFFNTKEMSKKQNSTDLVQNQVQFA
jgi:hypothetical protein